MIVEKIDITTAELNTGSDVVKTIEDVSFIEFTNQPSRNYHTLYARLDNQTGDDLEIVFLTALEKREYDLSATVTDKLFIKSTSIQDIDMGKNKVEYVVVKGLGTHTADLRIDLVKAQF